MKSIILLLFIFSYTVCFGQKTDIINLKEIDSIYNKAIKTKGLKLFKCKSKYYSRKKKYSIINQYWVDKSRKILQTDNDSTFLSTLNFDKKLKFKGCKLYNTLYWTILEDSLMYSSNHISFFKKDIYNTKYIDIIQSLIFKKLLNRVKYVFSVDGTNISINFVVLNSGQILAHNSRDSSLMTFTQFKEKLFNNEIEFYQRGR